MRKLSALIISLIYIFFCQAQTTFNAEAVNISSEIKRIEKERSRILKKNEKQKLSAKKSMIKMKHLADSTSYADYMIELGQVTAYAEKVWPSFEVYPNLKAAKKAFKEPYFSGGYTRVKSNLRSNFKQPEHLGSYFSIGTWGYITIRLLVDQEGNIIRTKMKTRIAPDIDEKVELAVLGLPQLYPGEFGGKKYPSAGTLVIEYEINNVSDSYKLRLRRKGVDTGGWGNYFMLLKDYYITWSPAITPML